MKATKLQERQGFFIEALAELHAEGNDWVYLPEITARAASRDEDYMKKRPGVRRLLRLAGIQRGEKPTGHLYLPLGRETVVLSLINDGSVRSQSEDIGARNMHYDGELPAMQYQLASMPATVE